MVFKAIKTELSVDRKKEEQRLSPLIHLRWQINVEGKPAKGDGRKAISEAERKLVMTKNNGRCVSLMCKYTGNVNEISGGFFTKVCL